MQRTGLLLILVAGVTAHAAAYERAQAQGFTGIFTSPANRYCLRQWPSGAVDCRFASLAQCRKAAKNRRDNCVVNNWETTGPNSLNRN